MKLPTTAKRRGREKNTPFLGFSFFISYNNDIIPPPPRGQNLAWLHSPAPQPPRFDPVDRGDRVDGLTVKRWMEIKEGSMGWLGGERGN